MDVDKSHHMLLNEDENSVADDQDPIVDEYYNSRMKTNLGTKDARILTMKCKAPTASNGK